MIFKTRSQDCVCYNQSCYYHICGQDVVPLVINNHKRCINIIKVAVVWSCPAGWIEHGPACYHMGPEEETWFDGMVGKTYCSIVKNF